MAASAGFLMRVHAALAFALSLTLSFVPTVASATTSTTSTIVTTTTTTTVACDVPCGPCEVCDPLVGCSIGPRTDCERSFSHRRGARVIIKKNDNPERDLFTWKRAGRAPTLFGLLLGNPAETEDLTACVFDNKGGTPRLLLLLDIPHDGTCPRGRQGEVPCWRVQPVLASSSLNTYTYKDRDRTPDGVDRVKIKPKLLGATTQHFNLGMRVKAKGPLMGLPPLDLEPPLWVQLYSTTGNCFGSTFLESDVRRNDDRQFKAKK